MDNKTAVNTILFIILIITFISYFNNNNYLHFDSNIKSLNIKNNYVINLDRRQDRWDDFLHKINKTSLSKEPLERFSAFDGSDYLNEFKRFNIEDHILIKKLKKLKLVVPKGVFGCMMSHLLILQKIRDNTNYDDDDYIGIFEEDIMFSNNFEENFEKLKNIDLNILDVELLYLGGRDVSDFSKEDPMFEPTNNPNIFYRKFFDREKDWIWSRCTFSYVVKKSVCSKLIDIIVNKFPTPQYGDPFKPIDHIYTDSYNQIKTFDFFPHLYYSKLNGNTDIQMGNLNNKLEFFFHTKNTSLPNLIFF